MKDCSRATVSRDCFIVQASLALEVDFSEGFDTRGWNKYYDKKKDDRIRRSINTKKLVTTHTGHTYRQCLQRGSIIAQSDFRELCRKVVGSTAGSNLDECSLDQHADFVLKGLASVAAAASRTMRHPHHLSLARENGVVTEVSPRASPDVKEWSAETEPIPSASPVVTAPSADSISVCVCFPSGETFLHAKVRTFDPVLTLVNQVRDLFTSEFMLLVDTTVLPTNGDDACKPVQDYGIAEGSIITLLNLGMTLASRNRLTKKQRLERDVKQFTILVEDVKLLTSVANKNFERFKGSHDSLLEARIGTNMMYVTRTAKCINEFRTRAGLKTLSEQMVRQHMKDVACTTSCYGVLNKQDFVAFYKLMLRSALDELRSDLDFDLQGSRSLEGDLRRKMTSGGKDFVMLSAPRGLYRLWKADARCQLLSCDWKLEIRDGSFEIQGDKIKFTW
eukprot:CAMPEP_0169086088 /NCGR_PEP_ID=MMETSP1015-20121227/13510_1 /TAXON_ID=342587 /ORGANISM="Karlodinium micrum, Strain CCMP2283" /LENGTH=447 /DNA_ID=CAMNT_0009146225 /DNA_START=56 /DNA_END=1396 /DNA_ORIENTATION=+